MPTWRTRGMQQPDFDPEIAADAMKDWTIKPWKEISDSLLHKTLFFELRARRVRSPRNGYEDDFFYVKIGDWVNIIPITADGHVVMVEQFRFGINRPCLELPGGMIDSVSEDPMLAALRELEEETGYTGTGAESLGFAHPNPALQNNVQFFFAVHNVEERSVQTLDQAEDIAVRLIPLKDIPEMIEQHHITHTLVVNAFYRYFARHGFPS